MCRCAINATDSRRSRRFNPVMLSYRSWIWAHIFGVLEAAAVSSHIFKPICTFTLYFQQQIPYFYPTFTYIGVIFDQQYLYFEIEYFNHHCQNKRLYPLLWTAIMLVWFLIKYCTPPPHQAALVEWYINLVYTFSSLQKSSLSKSLRP